MQSLFARHGGEIFAGTGDGFFVGFPSVDSALACAIGSKGQWTRSGSALAFILRRRVGMPEGSVAAASTRLRTWALGSAGEIVASTSTLLLATVEVPIAAVRTMAKGLPGEMEVATLNLDGLV